MEKAYYEEIAFLQFDFDVREFEELYEKGDEESMLRLASEYDYGKRLNEMYTYKKAERFKDDYLVVENESLAIIKNSVAGGVWTIYKKWKVEDVIKELIDVNNYGNCTDDLEELIREILSQWKQG